MTTDDKHDHRRYAHNGPALIRVEEVFRRYPTGVEALRGVSLIAHEGEVVCIIGPSGSGKSTLLRCVNGLEPIDRGRILFGDREVRGKGREARAIRQQIASAIHVVVQIARLTDGSRKVISVSEITGMEGESIWMQDIFAFDRLGIDQDGKIRGAFRATGATSRFADRLATAGYGLRAELFDSHVEV